MRAKASHLDTVAASLRGDKRLQLLSPYNEKTPKGEKLGYLQAIVYLAPHTLGGSKSLCPHSTEACRAGCLFTAGRGKTPRVENARMRRTALFNQDRHQFMEDLVDELSIMQCVADRHGMTLAIRLNGTSDILWEREAVEIDTGADEVITTDLFAAFPRARFFDYTRTPAVHRKVPENWHLTFSLADDPTEHAVEHLLAGRNVAIVVPEAEKVAAPAWLMLGNQLIGIVDGDEHDLRFTDARPALVLLKPKGRLLRGGPMVRHNLIADLLRAARLIARGRA